jgi:hypothetical protein
MPPTILNDAVQQVVDKLSRLNDNIHIPEPLLDRAREQLRILQIRVAVGKLGNHDRTEHRAAIVLEYVVRQSQSSSSAAGKLSMADLAKAVGIKLTHLHELHKVVGNFLQPAQQQQRKHPTTALQSSTASRLVGRAPGAGTTTDTTIAAPNSQLEKSRRLRSTMTQSANNASSFDPNNTLRSNSRIPDLAIRLAAFVVDPHGFSRQAEILLAAIEHHISSAQTAVHERRGNMYDLQRYRTAYEAACFYYVATTRGQQQQGGGVSKASARRKGDTHNFEDNNNNNNADDGDDGKHRPLQVADLVEASNDFTYLELKQVLPNVVELAERIEQEKLQQQKLQQQQRLQKEKQSQSTGSRNSTKKNSTTKSSKRKQAPDSSATTAAKKQAMIKEMTRQKDDHFHADYDNNHYNDDGMILEESLHDNDVVTFAEWKEQMLSQAIHQAKQDIRIENTASTNAATVDGNDDADTSNDIDIDDDNYDTISYETALERAADAVLLKYGLLSLPAGAAAS